MRPTRPGELGHTRQFAAVARRGDQCHDRDYKCSNADYKSSNADYKCSNADYKCSNSDYVCSHDDCSHDDHVIYVGRGTLWVQSQRLMVDGPSFATWLSLAPDPSDGPFLKTATLRFAAGPPGGIGLSRGERLPHFLRI